VFLARAGTAGADDVVQIPIDPLLDGRPVTTWTAGKIVTWTAGVDKTDGLMTAAAEAQLNETGVALPDDGTFAADARHPQIALHFSNASPATAPQAHSVPGGGGFDVPVAAGTYSKVFLVFTSSIGPSALTVTLGYSDGSNTTTDVTVPDWASNPAANDPVSFVLFGGMRKWTAQNQEVDIPTHTLTGVELTPAATKVLSTIHVDRPGTAQVVWFWGATGVATSLLDAGATPLEAGATTDAGAADTGAIPDATADTTGPVAEGGSVEGAGDGATDSGGSEVGDTATDASNASDAPAKWDNDFTPTSGCSLALSDRDTNGASWLVFAIVSSAIARRKRRE
jgi:hypothetical protein